jgi:uracil-DNA glycosylase
MASKYPSFFKLCEKWTEFFYSTETEEILLPILNMLDSNDDSLDEKTYYPENDNIFRCFYMTPYDNIKVVILGQDPYHNGSATGLCFDVKLGNPLNPSLQNIYKELESEGFYPVKDGNLENWTKQGVLLLNTALTVKKGKPESHLDLWHSFSEKIIKTLSNKDFIVWIILGKKASDWKDYITNKNHVILEATHPSPFSALKPSGSQEAFIGSKIFKNTNKELNKKGLDLVVW